MVLLAAPVCVGLTAGTAAAAVQCGPVVTQPLAAPPWPLLRLRPDLAWPLSEGAGVRVAVIDSGVSPNHPALSSAVVSGADFVSRGSGECDEDGHGTLVAGLIAGRDTVSGGFQFHGVAPAAEIVPVRVLEDQQRSFDTDLSPRIASAIRWAVDTGRAGVINLSLTTTPTPQLSSAVQYALSQGVVVVAAAGNDGDSQPGQPDYPAAYPGVIAVAGVDTHDQHVSTSTVGAYVAVAAPGVQIAGPAAAGGGFVFSEEGGTSFAAAYVSGVAALIRSYDPALSPAEVEQRIVTTADHPADGWDSQVGAGVVDPARALASLAAAGPPPLNPAAGPVRLAPVPPDPQREVRMAATWIAVIGLSVVLVVLIAFPVTRHGRARRWRSGRV